jgi:hypothetical protein
LHEIVQSLVSLFSDAVADAQREYKKLLLKKRPTKKSDKSDEGSGRPDEESNRLDLWATKNKYMKDKITLRAFGSAIQIPEDTINELSPHP